MTYLHHIIVVVLVVVVPIWDRHETRLLKTSNDPAVRIRSYQKTIGWQVVMAALLLLTLPFTVLYKPPAEAVAMIQRFDVPLLPILVGLLGGALIPVIVGLLKSDQRASQLARLQSVAFLLPRGRRERLWFAAVCITVGVCEEVIFRGFLIRYLLQFPPGMGVVGAAIGAAAIFGIDHGYQGIVGVISTTVLAIVFSLLFFVSGSLLVPIVVHALLDLRILAIVPREWEPGSLTTSLFL